MVFHSFPSIGLFPQWEIFSDSGNEVSLRDYLVFLWDFGEDEVQIGVEAFLDSLSQTRVGAYTLMTINLLVL